MSANKIDRTDLARERRAYEYAVRSQGYGGTWDDWQAMSEAEREEYEAGAAGIGTA